VANDDRSGAELAVNHLVQLGHKNHCATSMVATVAGALERRLGYENAMRRAGLGQYVQVVRSTFTEEGGRQGAETLLASSTRPNSHFSPAMISLRLARSEFSLEQG
jgi:LacI family transcriptional regulator